MKKRIITLILAIILLVPVLVKADNKYIDINNDVLEYTFNVENKYKEIGLCVGKINVDNVICIGQEDEMIPKYGKPESIAGIIHAITNNLIEYYDLDLYNQNKIDEELTEKYAKGELLLFLDNRVDYFARVISMIDNCSGECQKTEEEDGSKRITKIYNNNILIYEKTEDTDSNYEKQIIYDELGNKMTEITDVEKDQSQTVYRKDGNIVLYESEIDDKVSVYFSLGYLNVGSNNIEIMKRKYVEPSPIDTYYHITINREEEIIEDKKEDNNTIKEDDNIKESPNTGSTINIVIGLFLLISFSILLYFDKKHKHENSL